MTAVYYCTAYIVNLLGDEQFTYTSHTPNLSIVMIPFNHIFMKNVAQNNVLWPEKKKKKNAVFPS